ncbi:hypothetical protein [Oceanobacillus massiliensis]|uniref:hypothetical protein n=1 Tax=Oceanobacillus massiliensis TaxID=1465765 RepID=UPI00028A0CE2|nr:hypothetical protein [Oceanobacillus massiliensis]
MKKIGIDAGGTLTKVAYEERGRLHVKTYPNHDMEKLLRWLAVLSPDAVLHITGGKSSHISSAAHKIHHVDEFRQSLPVHVT